MKNTAEIVPPPSFGVEVSVPGSKSLANRALVCAALAAGRSRLSDFSRSEDSKALLTALRRLGFSMEPHPPRDLIVEGSGGRVPAPRADVHLGNAGTALRFVTALSALGRGTFHIEGDRRMHERPIRGLVDALRGLGAEVEYAGAEGFPPLRVTASGIRGGSVLLDARDSSQFLSALLLVAPSAQDPIEIRTDGPLPSRGYVALTLEVMSRFGIRPAVSPEAWLVRPSTYRSGTYVVEPDAAAAGYWFAMAAVTGGRATVNGLEESCLQPEIGFVQDLEAMGARVERGRGRITVTGKPLRGLDVSMNDRPDSVPTLAVTALFARGKTRIRDVAHLRHKESDRLAALAHELGKLGARVAEHADGLDIDPPARVKPAEIETYRDHRIAMSFAVAGVASPGIRILDPACVSKSYPNFWQTLKHCGIEVRWA